MADMKKLMDFRQLSLNSDKARSSKLRFPLGKQISEDICDKWFRKDLEFQVSLNHVNFKKPAIKQAWVDPIENIKNELVIKKIDKNRPRSERKLLQQSSVDFTKRLQENLKSGEEKCNIKIILAQNSLDFSEKYNNFTKDKTDEQPKFIKYLPTGLDSSNKNTFKIKKSSKTKDTNTFDTLWPVPSTKTENQPNTVYNSLSHVATQESSLECNNSGDIKPIASVLISPATAAVKRELFQKRTNLAFNETVDNTDKPKPRRPLVRSLSAPCKPEYIKSKKTHEKSKKIFLKTPKKSSNKNKESPKSPTDAGQSPVVQGKDVVTMVSLVSPAGSDCEEDLIEEISTNAKKIATELKSASKVSSLSKTTKTVSFQQSSIHAIRSFSASFPARRASVSSAMMFNRKLNASSVQGSKVQEKRATNSRKPDDDERMPKRRLVRNKENSKTANPNQPNKMEPVQTGGASTSNNSNVSKNPSSEDDCEIQQIEHDEGCSKESGSKQKKCEKDEIAANRNLKSDKEIQCWDMYCKMTEKGINVSFETILKGILTPTEYRLSKKHSAMPADNEPLEST